MQRAGPQVQRGVAPTGLRLREADVGKCPPRHRMRRACKGRKHFPPSKAHHLSENARQCWFTPSALVALMARGTIVEVQRIIDSNLHQQIPSLAR